MAAKRHRKAPDAAFVAGRAAAARAWARRKETERLKQLDLEAYFAHGHAAADAEVHRLREVRSRVVEDHRLDELLRLRSKGRSLAAALAEVEARFAAAKQAGGARVSRAQRHVRPGAQAELWLPDNDNHGRAR